MTISGRIPTLVLLISLFGAPLHSRNVHPFTTTEGAGQSTAPQSSFGAIPIYFEENVGQTDPSVRFVARGDGHGLFITDTGTVAVLTRRDPSAATDVLSRGHRRLETDSSVQHRSALRMELLGANARPAARGEDLLAGRSNYFIGSDPAKWKTNVAQYAKVRLSDVYPGIDLVYYGNQRQLEYDFIVRPGGDPRQIQFQFDGADQIELDPSGDLLLHINDGVVRQELPAVYKENNGMRQLVHASYRRLNDHQFGVDLDSHDAGRSLVIDPVLPYSTYLGGSDDDKAFSIAVDANGSAYVTGHTASTDFPTTTGALQRDFRGTYDVFVAKLNPDGSIAYATYLGGSGDDYAEHIALDRAGNAYVAGHTDSSDFPTTQGALQETKGNNLLAFVTKLNETGSALEYSTFLGGDGQAEADGIAVDAMGSAYVTGSTESPDFPTTPGALQRIGDGLIAFVSKLNPTGSALVYSTFLGGSGGDAGEAIAVDTTGDAYVTGPTESTDFPTTPGAFQVSNGDSRGFSSSEDAFVTKLNPTGSALDYSTYLGGSSDEFPFGIAIDSSGSAYVTGSTESTDFPTTRGSAQGTFGGSTLDGFVTKVSPTGSSLVYSTYLGGSGVDAVASIALDQEGNAYVTGVTTSSDFPTTPGALEEMNSGGAFLTKISSSGSSFSYSSCLAGANGGEGIAIDTSDSIYITGYDFVDGSYNAPVLKILAGNATRRHAISPD